MDLFWIFLFVVAAAVVIWATLRSPNASSEPDQPTAAPATSSQPEARQQRAEAPRPRQDPVAAVATTHRPDQVKAHPPARPIAPPAPPQRSAPKIPSKPAPVEPVRTSVPSPRSTPARWVPPGESVQVAGFSLPNGMLYVGRKLPPVKQWAREVEPALLDPTLPVDRRSIDVEGRLMTYWPSYSTINPASRTAYLSWLAGGRKAPEIAIGYVFLFFYGLERRLLFDHMQSKIPPAEIDAIQTEVARLLGIYGGSNSFRGYAARLQGLGVLLRRTVDVESLRPPLQRDGWEVPIVTRLALGVLANEGKPLPPEWALSWALTAPEIPQRTPAQRCPEEFRELFLLRYRESLGEGLRLRANKTRLKIEYQPASASFGGLVTLTVDLPDVIRSTATQERLRQLAEQCTQELDSYSRWVGRTGETASPPAIALLPAALARGRGDETTRALGTWLEECLGNRQLALIDSADLLTRWPSKEPGCPTRRELESLGDFLASRGVGIEPDVSLGGTALTRTKRAALFRLPEETRDKPSPAYKGAAVLLNLAAMVAGADGEVSMDEERHLMQHLDAALDLPATDRARLGAHFSWLAAAPPTFTRGKKRIEEVAEEDRQALGTFLISLAGADGHLAPDEVKVLSKVYPLLGLDPQSLYSDMHQLMSAQRAPAEEPVPVRPADLPQGFAIPRPAAEAAPQAVELDLAKVRAKLAETEQVSRLLGEIFVDEAEAVTAPPPAVPPAADDYAIAGLDGAHSALLLRLASAASWERVQVEKLAGTLGLLPDGALEVINEAAFAVCGAPLLEGDELIEIDKEVLQEMLP